MEVVIDYTDFLKNVFSAFFYGFALSTVYEIIKFIHKETPTVNIYRKTSRIMLKKRQILSREEIVKIGRDAIRCKKTNDILNDPVVLEDGYSYNKSSLNIQNNLEYENRALKEFIERLKNQNKEL
jgi:hypothetical protein